MPKLYCQEFQTAVNNCLHHTDGVLENSSSPKIKYVALALAPNFPKGDAGLALKLPWL